MALRPYKFQVVAIAQRVDDEGNVLGESVVSAAGGQPFDVFGVEGLAEWAQSFPDRLAAQGSD